MQPSLAYARRLEQCEGTRLTAASSGRDGEERYCNVWAYTLCRCACACVRRMYMCVCVCARVRECVVWKRW